MRYNASHKLGLPPTEASRDPCYFIFVVLVLDMLLALRDSSELFQKQNWKVIISSAHECASENGKLCYHHRYALSISLPSA